MIQPKNGLEIDFIVANFVCLRKSIIISEPKTFVKDFKALILVCTNKRIRSLDLLGLIVLIESKHDTRNYACYPDVVFDFIHPQLFATVGFCCNNNL